MTRRLQIPSEIHQAESTVLVKGKGVKADLRRVDWNGTPLVVKTFLHKSPLVRWFGRRQVRWESRAYKQLEGMAGIPVLHEGPDPYTLVMDHVEGKRLTRIRREPMPKRPVVEALQELINAVHRRGVAHRDLRRRDNILVDERGVVHLIDFATAHVSAPGSLRRRFLFPLFRSIDRGAFLKWKRLLTPEDLTERERRKLRRHRMLRAVWFYNRRSLGPSDRARLEEERRQKKRARQERRMARRTKKT
jgi:tRNA A-37 threonylcarbamoyl transferase component Bud32